MKPGQSRNTWSVESCGAFAVSAGCGAEARLAAHQSARPAATYRNTGSSGIREGGKVALLSQDGHPVPARTHAARSHANGHAVRGRHGGCERAHGEGAASLIDGEIVARGGRDREGEPLAVDVAHADERVGDARLQRHAERLALLIVERGLAAQFLARELLRPKRHHGPGQLLLNLLLPPIALGEGSRAQSHHCRRGQHARAPHRTWRRDAAAAASATAIAAMSSASVVAPSGAAAPSGSGRAKRRSQATVQSPMGRPNARVSEVSTGNGEFQNRKKRAGPISVATSARYRSPGINDWPNHQRPSDCTTRATESIVTSASRSTAARHASGRPPRHPTVAGGDR